MSMSCRLVEKYVGDRFRSCHTVPVFTTQALCFSLVAGWQAL